MENYLSKFEIFWEHALLSPPPALATVLATVIAMVIATTEFHECPWKSRGSLFVNFHLSWCTPLCTKLSKSYCNSCTEISTKALVCKRDSFMKTKKAKNCFQTASLF